MEQTYHVISWLCILTPTVSTDNLYCLFRASVRRWKVLHNATSKPLTALILECVWDGEWHKKTNCMCVCVDRWSVWWKPGIRCRVLICARRWASATPLYAGWTGDHSEILNTKLDWLKTDSCRRDNTCKPFLQQTHTLLWYASSVIWDSLRECLVSKTLRL